jgi:hypothetical protein
MPDRFLAGFAAIVRSLVGNIIVGPRIDYLAAYPCVAVSQNADGTLELVPDDKRIQGPSKVPIRYGVPGISATVAAGARVYLRWAGADPSKPYAEVWESAGVTGWNLTVNAGATVNIATGAGATVNIGGATSTSINLGAALQLVARSLDPLIGTAGPFPIAGTIGVPTQTNVKA